MNNETQDNAAEFLGQEPHRIAYRHTAARENTTEADPQATAATPSQRPSPEAEASPTAAPQVLFCGGFHSSMRGVKATELESFCLERGVGFTRFDYRGHGESDGLPEAFTLEHWLEDTLNVIDHINGPVILAGSSMGGWLAMLAAMRRKAQVKGLLLLAAAPDFLQELVQPRLSKADLWDLQQGAVLPLQNTYDNPYPLTQALLDSGRRLSLLTSESTSPLELNVNTARSQATTSTIDLHCPVRLIHGTDDADVPFQLSVRLMDKLGHDDAQLMLLHRGDHRLSDERSLRCVKDQLQQLLND